MREILFRAKEKETGVWVEGDLVRDLDCFGENKTCIYQITGKGCWRKHFVDPETACQYTGLTDKNGRKIFEGDIVKHDMSDTIGEVKWYCEDYVGLCVDDIHINEQQFTDEMWNECEVIGNIFDNPELIGE